MGIPRKNIFMGENGRVLEITDKTAKLGSTVPSGRVLIDGASVGDVGATVLRDRKHLSEDGLISVVMAISGESGLLVSGPDIVSRGFIYMKESDELTEAMRKVVLSSLKNCERKNITDWATIKTTVRNDLSGYLYRETRRSPMIIPTIIEV
jgi:ribonuclease J